MTILQQLCASSGTAVIIPTLELSCSSWASSILLTTGYDDVTATDENGTSKTWLASGIDIALPKRNAEGAQSLTFAIDNITGEAQSKIDAALSASATVYLTFRKYVSSDLTAPAETPLKFSVTGGTIERLQVQITAGFMSMTDYAWPRDVYNSTFAPGLKYLQS